MSGGFEGRRASRPGRSKPDVAIDPGRQALHRLMDEILDRRPDLQDKLLASLQQTMAFLGRPDAAVGMQVLTAGKKVMDAVLEYRGRRAG